MTLFKLYLRVLAVLRPESRLVLGLVLANTILAGALFVEPLLLGRIVDRLTRSTAGTIGWPDVLPLVLAWGSLGLFNIGCAVALSFQADRLSHRRRLGLMAVFFEHVLHLPLSFHGSTHSGRLLKVMLEGANGMGALWLSFFRENCASFTALLVMLPLSLVVNWRLGLVLIGVVLTAGLISTLVLRRTEGMQRNVEHYHSGLAERVADSLANVAIIQSFTRADSELRGLGSVIDALIRAQNPVLSWWAAAAVATRAASTLALVAIFTVGLALHFHGLATIGDIVAFLSFSTLMVGRLDQVVAFTNALFLQAPKLRDFFAVLDTQPKVVDRAGARDPVRIEGAVVFENVSFSYDGTRQAVSNLSFKVAAGSTVALVGQTGSGKSTTLSLLHRVQDPSHGRITIDGIDLRDMTLAGLRRQIGVVFQEPMLFARSIEDNLRVGNPRATLSQITSSLVQAQARDFVDRQPQGLATVLGERGRSLSGGERQRLAIARVLLKDPPILLLDEATSALDALTEAAVQTAIETAARGRTTLIIAHRLSTIRKADRILVFDQGRIVEEGSFGTLMVQDGPFAALAKAQGFDEASTSAACA